MVELTERTFQHVVLEAGRPVIVDFWAPWCRPCDRVAAVLAELERERPDVDFVKVNADESLVTTARCRVLALPTVLVFDGGHERARVAGVGARADYVSALR